MRFFLILLGWISVPFAVGMGIQFFRDGRTAYAALSLLFALFCLLVTLLLLGHLKGILPTFAWHGNRRVTPTMTPRSSSRVRNPINWGATLGKISSMARPVLAVAGKFFSFVFASYTNKPWMWSGVTVLVAAGYLFLRCYTFSDWHAFHVGLLALPIAGALFITHAGGWGRLFTSVSARLAVTHAVVSAVTLFICLGHALWWTALSMNMRQGLTGWGALRISIIVNVGWWYGAGMSLLSLIAAVITLLEGWTSVRGWLMRVARFVGGLFIGEPGGFLGAVTAWGMLLAVATIGAISFGSTEITGILYTAFILVVFGGVGIFTLLKGTRG